MEIHVIGGVYLEYCAWPEYNSIQGSAGRAALCLSQLDNSFTIHLHSRIAKEDEAKLKELFVLNKNCYLDIDYCSQTISFDYFHPLAEPKITPIDLSLNKLTYCPCPSKLEFAVVFGMIEATPKVTANTIVYDPQNTYKPVLFSETGGSAEQLVYITNKNELELFCKQKNVSNGTVEEMAKWLLFAESAEIVIVKCGGKGSYVHSKEGCDWIPAYQTDSVFPIGSGDSYVAAFSYYWHVLKQNPLEAAKKASIAAAYYVSNRIMNSVDGLNEFEQSSSPINVDSNRKKIYLAGPFFTLSELWMVNEAKYYIESFGMDTFSPFHELGIGTADEVVQKDIEAIKKCAAVYAIFNGTDPGTLFEVGYAISLNKPVVILAENPKAEELKMYEGSGCHIYTDFTSSIYKLSWMSL